MTGESNGAFDPAQDGSPVDKNNVSESRSRVGLERTIGLLGGSGLIVGGIIGSGIFITPSSVLEHTGSIGFALVMWVISGIIALFGGLCFAELGTTIPKSGAEYNYILESFGPLMAFLFIWTSVFIIKPACVTIVAVTSAIYIGEAFFPHCFVPEIIYRSLAGAIILSITLLNSVSVKWSIRINNCLMYSKFIAILLFTVIGFVNLRNPDARQYFSNPFENTKLNAGAIGRAFFQTLWAYDGWNYLNYASEEMINPEKNLPRSIIIGMNLITGSYFLINICYIAAIGPQGMLDTSAVGLTIGYKFLGKYSFFVPLLVASSAIGAAVSAIFGNGRLLFVAGRNGHLPPILSSIHKIQRTPIPSLVFTAIISLIMLVPSADQLGEMIDLFSFANWFFFLLCFVALIYLRYKKPGLSRPFKVWIIIPILMCLISVLLIILPIFEVRSGFFIALATILSGVPVYFIVIRNRHFLPRRMFLCFGEIVYTPFICLNLQLLLRSRHKIPNEKIRPSNCGEGRGHDLILAQPNTV